MKSENNALAWLRKRPGTGVAAMCAVLFFFGFCQQSNLRGWSFIYAGAVTVITLAFLAFKARIMGSRQNNIIFFCFCSVYIAAALTLNYFSDKNAAVTLEVYLMMLVIIAAMLRKYGRLNTGTVIILLIAAGIILRYVYVLNTCSFVRQHDVDAWYSSTGHSGYIMYWYNNGLVLPEVDVREYGQFYHPPLHHWLMALALRVFTLCGMEYDTACQATQVLPFTYSCLSTVVCYRIFRQVKLEGKPLVTAMAIICFFPAFIIMGGSFNNDMLSVLLALLAILLTLKWYEKPTWKRIVPVAFALGCAMMSKLSAWMAAPGIALIFLTVFVREIRTWKGKIGQFALFGVICAPLGLWWQVRNLIAYGVPLTYVPRISEQSSMYCGGMSVWQRLFDFGNGQLAYVYDAFTMYGAPYDEYNPTVGLFKTAVFDEGAKAITAGNFPGIAVTGPIFFWTAAALGLVCFAAFAVSVFRGDRYTDGAQRAFFGLTAATILVSYYAFCFEFPFTCTMNARYCMPLIPLFVMGLAMTLRRHRGNGKWDRALRYGVTGLTAAFCVMSTLIFMQIA